jgi:TldD protein
MTSEYALADEAFSVCEDVQRDVPDKQRESTWTEVFVERRATTEIVLDERRYVSVESRREDGASVRTVAGGAQLAATADGADKASLDFLRGALKGRTLPRADGGRDGGCLPSFSMPRDPVHDPVSRAVPTHDDWRRLLHTLVAAAEANGALVRSGRAALTFGERDVLVANSRRGVTATRSPQLRLWLRVVAASSSNDAAVLLTLGGSRILAYAANDELAGELGDRVGRAAVSIVEGRDAPAGTMPVVFANGTAGILLHEVCGHLLEGDTLARGSSVFADRLGQEIGPTELSISDDPGCPGTHGSYAIDDEGNEARAVSLVESGHLVGALHSSTTWTPDVGVFPAHGRRESYLHLPHPRLANLVVHGGAADPGALVADVPVGLYVEAVGDAAVDPRTGAFRIVATVGRMIRSGRLREAIRGAIVRGSSGGTLRGIDGVAGDSTRVDTTCRKRGRAVPVSHLAPTIRVRKMEVTSV